MIKIFKKGLTASEGCRRGLSGSRYGCCRFIRSFGWVCVAAEMLAASLLLGIFWKQKGEKGNAEGA